MKDFNPSRAYTNNYTAPIGAKLTKTSRAEYKSIARDLLYPESVIQAINNAKTETECINILAQARKDMK